MAFSRRNFLQTAAILGATSIFPSYSQQFSLTLWGPPVSPTILLAIAAMQGKAKEIIPFNVKIWRNPDQLRAGLLNGSIGISIVPSYVAANLRNQGQKVFLHNIMTQGLLSFLSKNAPVLSPEQLEQQKIVMPFKGDMPDLVLQILAKRSGIKLPDITYTSVPPEAVALFLKKDFSTALLPEPVATAALLKAKKEKIDVFRGLSLANWWNQCFDSQNGIMQAGLMITDSVATQYADFLAALDSDLENAVQWIREDPQQAAEIGVQYLPIPIPAWQQSFAHSALCAIKAKTISEEILQFLEEIYSLNPKITGGKKPTSDLFA
ncbi:ABC transporter substrate-binding protein [Suttonella ornithocola]|uniref:ABC-type taurine transport system, periplasmic component n=1 Tax=Suttonella ornithocola TaxID=279832 RepID=A0A380MPH6_9GAMM|nr:ABC transporter substrate-binding protein [Suttonella ornithocola]SUO93197.1 Uncharacterised protein [Suttonella ornithocola]